MEKPVPREVLTECLELAIQAPTGSNAQGWQWVFVEDADKKKALGDIYRKNATPYLNAPKPEFGDMRDDQRPLVTSSAKYLNEHLHEVPVMLIPCLKGRPDGAPAGLFPIAYTKGTDFRPAKRLPVEQIVHWDSW